MARIGRPTATLLTAALLAIGVTLSPAAGAGPAAPAAPGLPVALQASGPFSATADSSLLTVDVPALAGAEGLLPQTNVDLARSQAATDSAADLDPGKPGAQRTAAAAGTTGTSSVLGAPLDLASNTASAPPSEANEDVVLPLEALPLFDIPVITTSAIANWVSDTACVASADPLSLASQALADVTVLEVEPGQSLLEVDLEDDSGAADTVARTDLISIPGPGDPRAVQASAVTRLAGANVLNGFVDEGVSLVEANVVRAPNYVATASGLPGGASATTGDPMVEVSIAGQPVVELTANSEPAQGAPIGLALSDILGPLSPLLDELTPVVRVSMPITATVAADGTSASVVGALLLIEVLPPEVTDPALAALVQTVLVPALEALGLDITSPLASIAIAPAGVEAIAPTGGITCGEDGDDPLRELNKTASAAEVAPGGEFDYTIFVPNRGECTLTDVVVVDTITGPAGFEVVGTEPPGTVEGGTVTFDVGTIEPNETVVLKIRVRVPADAPDGATFDDRVTATGVCDGEPVERTRELLNIPTVRTDFEGPCNVEFSNKESSHDEVTPGQTFAYLVNAFNSGAEACTGITVTDTLDDRVEFVSCNGGCEVSGQTVTWVIDSLPGGSSASLSVVVQVLPDATGTLANTAVIDPENGTSVTVTFEGPVVTDTSVPRDPVPPARDAGLSRGPAGLPRTGAAVPLLLAGVAALGGLALGGLRRRATSV